MSYSLSFLWFWIRFIAVLFYLTLSRVGEAENPGPVWATAKLFGANYDAIGLWAQNLSNKSEVELEPLFAQVGECRQMFSERFGKESKLYTSSVSQDIHSTHSLLESSSLPVPTERNEDLAHTQQVCDYLSLSFFQEGEQGGSGHHVLSNLHFRGMEGKERSNPFCHRATRGGRKHTGKKRKLELSKGVVNMLQCNVTTWSEHARHYILTSIFDAALISETRLGKERLLSAVTEAKKSGWAGTGSATKNTVNYGTSAGVLALVRKRWFSKHLSICRDDAGILCPNSRLAGRVIRVMGREILLLTAYFEHSVSFRSDTNANLMQDVCFLTRDGRVSIHSGCGFQLSAKPMARSDSAWRWHLDQATGCIGGHSGRLLTHVSHGQRPKTRHRRLFHGVCMHSSPDTKMSSDQIPVCYFSYETSVGRDFHATWMRHP